MKMKIKLAGIAAAVLFCGIGIVTAGVLVYRVPALAALLVLGFYAIYENLAHRVKRKGSGVRSDEISSAVLAAYKLLKPESRRKELDSLREPPIERWYENPQLEALMDLGLTSDQARAELARQARYGAE